MRQFDYRVAIRVPGSSRDAANQAVADITGNPVDLHTFGCQITDGEQIQWLSEVWMRAQYFDQLPAFQDALGGEYAPMAHRVDGRWVQLDSVWDWVNRAGFYAVESDDEV
jgi:hypothetical protein